MLLSDLIRPTARLYAKSEWAPAGPLWPALSFSQRGVANGFGSIYTRGTDFVITVGTANPRDTQDPAHRQRLLSLVDVEPNIIVNTAELEPLAFISHDSRDKAEIAQPLALQLMKFMCPVWYDEFALKVGDSLRASIEAGLKACPKCIFVLTPNFLANSGWSKTEYDSIFTRELVEKQRVILPVWHNVTPKDVYEYSPILADRVAVNWSLGVDEVARRLLVSINQP
jgi:hypothetical protein